LWGFSGKEIRNGKRIHSYREREDWGKFVPRWGELARGGPGKSLGCIKEKEARHGEKGRKDLLSRTDYPANGELRKIGT